MQYIVSEIDKVEGDELVAITYSEQMLAYSEQILAYVTLGGHVNRACKI